MSVEYAILGIDRLWLYIALVCGNSIAAGEVELVCGAFGEVSRAWSHSGLLYVCPRDGL